MSKGTGRIDPAPRRKQAGSAEQLRSRFLEGNCIVFLSSLRTLDHRTRWDHEISYSAEFAFSSLLCIWLYKVPRIELGELGALLVCRYTVLK